MRAAPTSTVTVNAGSVGSVTELGFEHTHTSAAAVTGSADAELGV
jgi:hypothetical protein